MWYKIDFARFAVYMLPPVLRSVFLVALLKVMVMPLRYIYDKFYSLKEKTDDRLDITGNVQYLEKALNDAFCLTGRQIYIVTPDEVTKRRAFYFRKEAQPPACLFTHEEGNGLVFGLKNEYFQTLNFIVRVPTFLCTSTESREEDKFGWEHYLAIRNILDTYKPAGRTFGIELYDYE